jgi:hypothetical protein
MAQGTKGPAAALPLNGTAAAHAPVSGVVNRKKQKRREKLAAKQAADVQKPQPPTTKNGFPPHGQASTALAHSSPGQPAPRYADPELDDPAQYDDDGDFYSDEDDERYEHEYGPNGHYPSGYAAAPAAGKKTKKKKKGTMGAQQQPPYHHTMPLRHVPFNPSPPPHLNHDASHRFDDKDRIWNTSSSEERERIREFWLSLGEDERKSLVKIEKEAVLRKMKEQQKHSCSCTVCGRKRTAIEEELEVLYDAYYEELEQYANHQQDAGPTLPPAHYTHASAHHHRPMMTTHPPVEHYDDADDLSQGDEEEGDEDYSNSEISSEEDYSSEERSLPPPEADFLQFGSSLQVKGNVTKLSMARAQH